MAVPVSMAEDPIISGVQEEKPVPATGMTKRQMRALMTWMGIAIVSQLIFLGMSAGIAYYFTTTYAAHACQALNLITQHPVPKPANPAANPSRETNYLFYKALVTWRDEDGCH